MASIKAVFGDVLGPLFLHQPVVASVRDVAPQFRRVELAGDDLRGLGYRAGDKVQVFLPGVGPRTYTPFGFDATRGVMQLLVYAHGESPGAVWGRRISVGERVRVFGPRSSLALEGLTGPVVLFGDETSFAVARALVEKRGSAADVGLVFECDDKAAADAALADLGLAEARLVARGDGHLSEVEAELRAALGRSSGGAATLVLTGKATSIQAIRAAFKARPAAHAKQMTKAYWAPGKVGLD
jgi:NADPH-dependent ferric siderophore reductase